MVSFKLGKLYKIRFYDHSQSDEVEDVLICEVCGWVRRSTKTTVSISTWDVKNVDLETKTSNDSIYNIARRLIISSVLH